MSRRNGEVEGNLGSIRLFAVLPRFHGLCIGLRLLKKTESYMFRANCVRCMACAASTRLSAGKFRGVIEEGVIGLRVFFSILVASCFMWSAALDSPDVILSYPLMSLASPMTNILISNPKH